MIYLADLSAGFITKKNPKIHIFFLNKMYYCLEITELAWKSRSQFFIEISFLAFYIQPGQILVKRFVQMIFLAVLTENTVQCPKT